MHLVDTSRPDDPPGRCDIAAEPLDLREARALLITTSRERKDNHCGVVFVPASYFVAIIYATLSPTRSSQEIGRVR